MSSTSTAGAGAGSQWPSVYRQPRTQNRPTTDPEQLTVEAQGVGDDPITLPKNCLPCLGCGVHVPDRAGSEVVSVDVVGREGELVLRNSKPVTITATRCPACSGIRSLAARSVTDRLASRLGRDTATHRLECALDGLSALGMPLPDHLSEAEADALVRHLAAPGHAVRWLSRFTPALAADARLNSCSPSRWAHVRLRQRAALREGYGALLHERVARSAPPLRLAPPRIEVSVAGRVLVENGCMMCGVSSVAVSAVTVALAGSRERAARSVWTELQIAASALGGPGPERLLGHLCRVCAEAVNHVGSVGPTSMERALVAALAPDLLGRVGPDGLEVRGLRGWATLSCEDRTTDTGRRAWSHLDDVDSLATRLAVQIG